MYLRCMMWHSMKPIIGVVSRLLQVHFTALQVFALALIPRLLWWAVAYFYGDYSFCTDDSIQYIQLADNVLLKGCFSLSPEAPFYPDIVRTPGYPFWLIPFRTITDSVAFIALVQSIMGALVPVLVLLTIRRIGMPGASAAAFLTVIDLSLVVFTPLALSDGLFALLIALLVYLLTAPKQTHRCIALTALVMTALIFTRPIALYLPLGLLIWWQVRGASFKAVTMGFVMALTLPTAWMYRNYTHHQTFTMSSIGVNTLYLFHAAHVQSKAEARTFEAVQAEYLTTVRSSFDWEHDPEAVKRFLAHCRQQSLAVYRAHPLETIEVTASNVMAFFVKPPRAYFDLALGSSMGYAPVSTTPGGLNEKVSALLNQTGYIALGLSLSQLVLNLLQLALCAVGLRYLFKRKRPLAWLVLCLLIYFASLSALTQTDARFRLPVIPVMALAWSATFYAAKPRSSYPTGSDASRV